jgi:hypothetical protein
MDSLGIVEAMPRKASIDIPGLLQHVIVQGIEKRKIILDDDDCRMFVDRFSSLLAETGTDCFAWAMLGNHFHLLLRCNRTRLSARAVFCYVAVRLVGKPGVDVGRVLGMGGIGRQ